MNIRCPNIDPCGIPNKTGEKSDLILSISTDCCLLER